MKPSKLSILLLILAACGGAVGTPAEVVSPPPQGMDVAPEAGKPVGHDAGEADQDAAPPPANVDAWTAPDVGVDARVDAGQDSAEAAVDAPILLGCPVTCEGGTYRVSCNCGLCGCPVLGQDSGVK